MRGEQFGGEPLQVISGLAARRILRNPPASATCGARALIVRVKPAIDCSACDTVKEVIGTNGDDAIITPRETVGCANLKRQIFRF